jgi:hypothetical protein
MSRCVCGAIESKFESLRSKMLAYLLGVIKSTTYVPQQPCLAQVKSGLDHGKRCDGPISTKSLAKVSGAVMDSHTCCHDKAIQVLLIW